MEISNTMSTKVALDTLGATNSIRGLTSAVTAANNAWRAQELQLKAVGDNTGAIEAKYKGLGETIDRQKAKIAELTAEQAKIEATDKKGAEAFMALQKQIDSANRQLASYEAQQSKAKSTMSYYTSGLAELQRGYRNAEAESKSYVDRLTAEGRAEEANEAKLKGLKSSITNLTEQYAKQKTEMSSAATEFGKTSDEYSKAKVRYNETGTAIAKSKNDLKELQEQMARNVPETWTTSFKNKLLGLNRTTEETKSKMSILRGTMLGAFAGNAVFSGVMMLGEKLKESAKDGIELAEQGEQTKRVWSDLGLSSKGIKQMSDEMVQLRNESGYSAGSIKQLQKQMYGMTGSASGAEKMTKAIVSMGVESGLTEKQTTKMSSSLSRVFASSSVTASQFTRLEKQMPGLSGAMAKAAGVSKSSFNDMITSGKVSGQQFQDLMEKVSKQSPEMFKSFAKTGAGAMAEIKGKWTSLKSNMMAPLVDVKGSGLADLSKAMDSKQMVKASEDIGKGLSSFAKGLASVVDYAANHSKDLLGIAAAIGSIAKALAVGAWKVISGLVNGVANAFNNLSGNSKKAHDPIKGIDTILSAIAKHKGAIEALGGTLVTAFAGAKLLKGVGTMVTAFQGLKTAMKAIQGVKTVKDLMALTEASKATKALGALKLGFTGLTRAMMANPFVAIAAAIVALGVVLVELYKHNKKFRAFVNGMAKDAKKAIGQIVKFFTNLGKNISKFFGGIGKWASKGWNGIKKATSSGAKTVGKAWSSYNKTVVRGDQLMWKDTKKAFSNGWNGLKSATNGGIRNVEKIWNNLHSSTGKIAKQMMKEHPRTFKAGYKVMQDESNTWRDITSGHWSRLGSDTKRTLNDMVKFWKSIFKEAYDYINKLTGGRLGDMLSTIKNIMGQVGKFWSAAWGDVRNVFGSIWNDIKNLGKDGINGVIGFLNGGIGGIDSVIKFFGGKSDAIPKVAKLATGTVNGRLTHDTLAVLNDGHDSPETGNRELVQKKDGRSYLVKGTNTLAWLQAGDAVLSARQTRQALMGMVPHFASGSFLDGISNAVSGAVNWAGGKLGDVGSWLGDKIDAVEKFLKDPVGEVTKVFDKSIGDLSNKAELVAQMTPAAGHWMIKQGKDWFKKLFDSLNDANSPAGTMSKSAFSDIANQAASLMGQSLSSSDISHLYWQAMTESSVNPAQNGGYDDHDGTGLPVGLFQYKLGTWASWAVRNHTNIHSALDQIMAVLNDSSWRSDFPPEGTKRGWGPSGHRMMANGGLVSSHSLVEMAEGDKPEMVIPMDTSKRSRASQLLGEVVAKFAGDSSHSSDSGASTDKLEDQLGALNDKFDVMLNYFAQLLGLTADQTRTIADSAQDKDAIYRQQAKDKAMRHYQGGGTTA